MAAAMQKNITLENMSTCLKTMEYAVRGPLVIRAAEIEKEIQEVFTSFSFKRPSNNYMPFMSGLLTDLLLMNYRPKLTAYEVVYNEPILCFLTMNFRYVNEKVKLHGY